MATYTVRMPDGTIVDRGISDEQIAEETQIATGAGERKVRLERDRLLTETDWVITMHKELGTNIPAAWKTYRQALRDITTQEGFPNDITWPEKP